MEFVWKREIDRKREQKYMFRREIWGDREKACVRKKINREREREREREGEREKDETKWGLFSVLSWNFYSFMYISTCTVQAKWTANIKSFNAKLLIIKKNAHPVYLFKVQMNIS